MPSQITVPRLRLASQIEYSRAVKAWERAPLHIKLMAQAYVDPLISAIGQMNDELGDIQQQLKVLHEKK